jgi:hypothetical protein
VTTRQLCAFILAQDNPTAPGPQARQPINAAIKPTLTKAFWSSFWKSDMLHKTRNVWWRLLIGRLPTGRRLNPIFDTIPTQCRVCDLAAEEDDQHFLFSCPKKMAIWQPALSKYLAVQNWTPVLVESLFYPKPPVHQPLVDLSAVLLLSAIMAMIWKHHWKTVIDAEPFDTDKILSAVDSEINYLLAQAGEKKRLQAKKRPPSPPSTIPPEPP